eukprot:TRINITY_DN1446_c2_g2_i1.p2 TRINITY_DN1446_c2_g2~~TRINITY_DN1446_c2_g2_i1.p2  ORF type:complete len:223 (+),score=87.34 TRINITY_DN1446_c2_g2_i1:63-671(+)
MMKRTLVRCFSMIPQPPLDGFTPVLSEETVSFHYTKHHTGYYNKLKAFAETERPDLLDKSNEDIIKTETGFAFNQAAQLYNHDFYWNSMSNKGADAPSGELAAKIVVEFGSFEEFKKAFQGQVGAHFGSGWVWLVQEKDTKKLKIVQTHDAGCPITDDNLHPILTCDAWEHAFYIDYRNDKPKYAENWWNIVNWEFAASNLL